MPHARLTHPLRGDLEFRQGQEDTDSRASSLNLFREIGVPDRKPLVHVVTRERERSIQGLVTGFRRADADPDTDDPEQALANYVDRLEAHMDEFQGGGYTFEDDLRNLSLSAVYTSLEWTYQPDAPYQVEFDVTVTVGRGLFDERAIQPRNPTVDTGMDVLATVDGNDLPGVDEMRVTRDVGIEPKAVYDKGNAENNDILITDGPLQRVVVRGTQSGTDAERRQADADLAALEGGGQVTLSTRFPGYDLDGYVINYTTTDEARRGGNQHRYELEFIEGERA